VAQNNQFFSRVFAFGQLYHIINIVADLIPLIVVYTLSAASSMPAMVEAVYREALPVQPVGEMIVSPAVFSETVNDYYNSPRIFRAVHLQKQLCSVPICNIVLHDSFPPFYIIVL
jgi:hypothetical protein